MQVHKDFKHSAAVLEPSRDLAMIQLWPLRHGTIHLEAVSACCGMAKYRFNLPHFWQLFEVVSWGTVVVSPHHLHLMVFDFGFSV